MNLDEKHDLVLFVRVLVSLLTLVDLKVQLLLQVIPGNLEIGDGLEVAADNRVLDGIRG